MRRESGFTLLEVLVVLVLLGLLMVALFGGFRAGLRSWQVAEQHVEQVEEPRQLSGLLYRHLGQLYPARFARDEQGEVVPTFVGGTDHIRYVAPLSLSSDNRPYLFEWVSSRNGVEGVWARFAPYAPNRTPDELLGNVPYVQLGNSVEIRFAYFDTSSERPGWVDEYRGEKPPPLVSFRLRQAGQSWPVLTFETVEVSNEPPPALRFVR